MATDTADMRDPSLPPPYDQDPADVGKDEMQEPSILVIAGQSIYAESANTPELYRLNRGIASLGFATPNVELTRVERTVSHASTDPTIKQRERHIYNLASSLGCYSSGMHMVPATVPRLIAAPVSSRSSLGRRFAFRKVSALSMRKREGKRVQWEALPLTRSSRDADKAAFEEDGQPLFEVCKQGEDGRFEWTDARTGSAVAFEEVEEEDDDGGKEPKMVVTAELERIKLDALVALWCCRVWERSAEGQPKIHEGANGFLRKLNQGSDFNPLSVFRAL